MLEDALQFGKRVAGLPSAMQFGLVSIVARL